MQDRTSGVAARGADEGPTEDEESGVAASGARDERRVQDRTSGVAASVGLAGYEGRSLISEGQHSPRKRGVLSPSDMREGGPATAPGKPSPASQSWLRRDGDRSRVPLVVSGLIVVLLIAGLALVGMNTFAGDNGSAPPNNAAITSDADGSPGGDVAQRTDGAPRSDPAPRDEALPGPAVSEDGVLSPGPVQPPAGAQPDAVPDPARAPGGPTNANLTEPTPDRTLPRTGGGALGPLGILAAALVLLGGAAVFTGSRRRG